MPILRLVWHSCYQNLSKQDYPKMCMESKGTRIAEKTLKNDRMGDAVPPMWRLNTEL